MWLPSLLGYLPWYWACGWCTLPMVQQSQSCPSLEHLPQNSGCTWVQSGALGHCRSLIKIDLHRSMMDVLVTLGSRLTHRVQISCMYGSAVGCTDVQWSALGHYLVSIDPYWSALIGIGHMWWVCNMWLLLITEVGRWLSCMYWSAAVYTGVQLSALDHCIDQSWSVLISIDRHTSYVVGLQYVVVAYHRGRTTIVLYVLECSCVHWSVVECAGSLHSFEFIWIHLKNTYFTKY